MTNVEQLFPLLLERVYSNGRLGAAIRSGCSRKQWEPVTSVHLIGTAPKQWRTSRCCLPHVLWDCSVTFLQHCTMSVLHCKMSSCMCTATCKNRGWWGKLSETWLAISPWAPTSLADCSSRAACVQKLDQGWVSLGASRTAAHSQPLEFDAASPYLFSQSIQAHREWRTRQGKDER